MGMPPPAGTITFLFTDIEGSTPLWEAHRQSMQQALLRHDAILREIVDGHNGFVFKTVGDAFCIAFARAIDALLAAIGIQRRLNEVLWPTDIGSLRVRIGLHSGTAVERDNDYFGPAVNRVARIEAAAHGGQILLSHAVEELVLDELPDGVALDTGQFETAAQLRGAAQALLEELSAPLSPLDRKQFSQDELAVRQVLDDDAFRLLWEQGSNLSWEQAAELALAA